MATLDTIFKRIYGEALAPYGYIKVKGRRPYFARLIGDEILHIITYKNETCLETGYKAFAILGGIATTYRLEMPFKETPRDNVGCLESNSEIYGRSHLYDADAEYFRSIISFSYESGNEESMISSMNHSLEITKNNLLFELNKVMDLRACVEYYYTFNPPILKLYNDEGFGRRRSGDEYNEGLINLKVFGIEEYAENRKKKCKRRDEYEQHLINIGRSGLTEEMFNKIKRDRQEGILEQIAIFETLVNDEAENTRVLKELEERKKANLEALREYGFEI